MAKHVLTNAEVLVNAVDLSDHVSSVTIETTRPEVDVTSMGATFQEFIPGLGDATVTVSFFQDFASGKTHQTLQPLFASTTPFNLWIKPDKAAAISATNPQIQMSALLYTYNPLAATVGEANTFDATFRNASQTGVVYDITP
jgi:hypothetical protein